MAKNKKILGMSRSGAIELGTWLGAAVVNAVARPADPMQVNATAARVTGAAVVAAGIYGWSQHEHTRWIDAFMILSGLSTMAAPEVVGAIKQTQQQAQLPPTPTPQPLPPLGA